MNTTSISGKKWLFKEFDSSDVKKYTELYSLSDIVAKLLSIRKKNISNVDIFLNPTIKNLLPNPLLLKNMNIAIDRTYQAILKNEFIGIFGDYDVDGATSTALLKRYFLSIKQKTHTYIPDRKKDGYGPTVYGFNNLIKLGVKIIFTVDCGTLSFEPIRNAQSKEVDVIVLDHHQSDLTLPNACAIVNPNRYDDTSRLNYLCAAGVCFMFLVGINKKLRDNNWFKLNNLDEPNIINLLDLVSLGTVCDVVPLIDLNRAIVKQGLKIIKRRSNLGLKTLYDLCKIESQPTVYDLGYVLGPRINAGGRMGKSQHGLELLISEDPQKTYKIASDLDKFNNERKSLEKFLFEKIDEEVKKIIKDPVIVVAGKEWHEGIIGIIASRIKEKYNKPAIIISLREEIGKGSARSIYGFDIGTNIINCVQSGILQKGGGHKMAGGFSISKEMISEFRNYLIKRFNKSQASTHEYTNLYLDSAIAPSALNEEFYKDINLLAPFGPGNSEPKFVIEGLKVINSNVVAENHIKSLLVGKDGTVINSFAWNAKNSPYEQMLNKKYKKKINVAGKIKLNEWRGKKDIYFIIEDISTN